MGMSDTVVGAVPMETSGPPSARKQSAHVFALISSVPVARRDRPGSGAILPLAAAGDAFDAGPFDPAPGAGWPGSGGPAPARDLVSNAVVSREGATEAR